MASTFDSLPKPLQSLQLLIEQFRDAEAWEERDEVLADIIAHDTPEALVFLRLIANNADEDVYTRCDAACGLFVRTQGAEGKDAVLAYLDDPESVYEFCRAADAVAEQPVSDAEPKLWAAWKKDLGEEALHSTILALEAVAPDAAATKLCAELVAQESIETIEVERGSLILKTLARLKHKETKPLLVAWEAKLRALAKANPEDEGDFHDMADLTNEALQLYDEPNAAEGATTTVSDDEDDDL